MDRKPEKLFNLSVDIELIYPIIRGYVHKESRLTVEDKEDLVQDIAVELVQIEREVNFTYLHNRIKSRIRDRIRNQLGLKLVEEEWIYTKPRPTPLDSIPEWSDDHPKMYPDLIGMDMRLTEEWVVNEFGASAFKVLQARSADYKEYGYASRQAFNQYKHRLMRRIQERTGHDQ